MSHPLRVVAHLGDVVEGLLQGPIDLDAFFDTHGGASCAPNTFSGAMMPAHEALRAASTLYSPKCLEKMNSRKSIYEIQHNHRVSSGGRWAGDERSGMLSRSWSSNASGWRRRPRPGCGRSSSGSPTCGPPWSSSVPTRASAGGYSPTA